MSKRWIWDSLASKNPIHAAISASSEEGERVKTIPQIETILSLIGDRDGIVLDAGCGYGRIAKYLLPQKAFKGWIGIDLSEIMLHKFQTILQQHQWSTPTCLIRSDLKTIPIQDESVDVIITIAVLLHCPRGEVPKIISEFYRVLKPGGCLVALVSFPNVWTFSGFQGLFYEGLLSLLGRAFINGPVRYYSRQQVLRLFSRFSNVRIMPSGFGLIPKRILGLPVAVNKVYRTAVYDSFSSILTKWLPKSIQSRVCMHWDVFAVK